MEWTACSPPQEEHGGVRTLDATTNPMNDGTGLIEEDYGVVPDLGSLFLSTDELITMNVLEPEDPTPLESGPSTEAKLGLISARSEDIFMFQEGAALPEDHSIPFMQPPEDPAVSVPDLQPYTFGTPHTGNPTELVSSQQEHETELECLELQHLMAEDSVQSQVDLEPLVWWQENNEEPGPEELVQSYPPPYFKAMENATIFQPSMVYPPPEAPCELQPFPDRPRPSLLLNMPSTSNYVSAEPCVNARHWLESDYPQLPRLQHINPSYLQPDPYVPVIWMQSNNQLTPHFFQPSLHPTGNWLVPYSPYMMFNQFGPQVPQMYVSSTSSVNSPPPLFNEVPLHPSLDVHHNIRSLEQPVVMQSCCNGNNHPQEIYNNYRRWQMFSKVAASVSPSSSYVEALACFFIQVISSITLQHPGIPRFEAVRIAVSEWEKLSNSERMEHYQMAQRFRDLELEEMESLWMAEAVRTSSQDTEQQWQTPTVKDEPPATVKGDAQKQNSYPAAAADRTSCVDQAEVASKKYSKVMEDPEVNNKEEPDDNQDTEVKSSSSDDEEHLLTEFVKDVCSQKFVSEIWDKIDKLDVSLLLSPDSNILQRPDVLKQLELLNDQQDKPTGVTLAPEECHLNPQTADESISAATSEPQPQTLQPGFYVDDTTLMPSPISTERAALLNQFSDPEVTLPDNYDPVPASSIEVPFQNLTDQDTCEMSLPPHGPLSYLQRSSAQHCDMEHLGFVAENCSVPIQTQEDIANPNDNGALEAYLPDQNSQFPTNELPSSHVNPTITDSISEDTKQPSSPKSLSVKVEQRQSIAVDSSGYHNDLPSPENAGNKTLAKSNISGSASVETSKDAVKVAYELTIVKEVNDNKCRTGKQNTDLQDDNRTDMKSREIKGNTDEETRSVKVMTEDPVIIGSKKTQSCGTSEAKEAVEELAKTKQAQLSLDPCLRILRSNASTLSADVPVKNQSEEMPTIGTKSRIRIRGSRFERGKVHDLVSKGRTDQRRLTRSCTASQRHQVGKRGRGKQVFLKSRKKMKTNLNLSRAEGEEVKRNRSLPFALGLPQTAQKVELTNESQEELEGPLTRARRANKERSLKSLPKKKQKLTRNLKKRLLRFVQENGGQKRKTLRETIKQMEERGTAQASQKGLRLRRSDRLATL